MKLPIDLPSFAKIKSNFQLGHLTTESFNPITNNFSTLAKTDLFSALQALKDVDLNMLSHLKEKEDEVFLLAGKIKKIVDSNKKIFISGCGATGRLALTLETLFRDKFKNEQVIGFMAGGDYALIKSVESFEDREEFGARQLKELGFDDGDLVIGITEGGETSFVIGSIKAAIETSIHPYFIYCNPDEELANIERSQQLILNTNIEKLNLSTGPMAISGSTRMQATSAQMLCVGMALLYHSEPQTKFSIIFKKILNQLEDLAYEKLMPLIVKEAETYQKKGYITYQVPASHAISVLTDTTERSPTFSLPPFAKNDESHHSLSYLTIKSESDTAIAWERLLRRKPRGLTWEELPFKIDNNEIYKFELSSHGLKKRLALPNHQLFDIRVQNDELVFLLDHIEASFKKGADELITHLQIKLLLNVLSTTVMARLGRIENNMMIYVRTSNYKLIDRAIRYVQRISDNQGKTFTYETIMEKLFEVAPDVAEDESIVLRVIKELH